MATTTLSNYSHLHKKCICEMCNCGKHKCPKPHKKGDYNTSYEKDYPNHEGGSPTQSFKKNHNYIPSHYNPNEMVSNYQAEFIPKENNTARPESVFLRNGQSSIMQQGQFEGQSAYNNSYKGYDGNYKDLRANVQKRQNALDKCPFEGQSHYVENFTGATSTPTQQIKAKGNLEVGAGKFDGQSTYNKNYVGMPSQYQKKYVPVGNLNVGEGKFNGDSTYSQNYNGAKGTPALQYKSKDQLGLDGSKFNGQSTYNQNYLGSIGTPSSKIIKQGQLGLNNGKFDSSTTYNTNYEYKPGQRQYGERPPSQKNLLRNDNKSYNNATSYNTNYQGGIGERGEKIVHKSELKIGSGDTFQGQSAYTNAYKEMKPQIRGSMKPVSNGGVLPQGNFQGDSTYTAHYNQTKGTPSKPIRYKDTTLIEGAFNGSTTYGDNYVERSIERIKCPIDNLNPPKDNLFDQSHTRFNAKLGVWN